MSDVVFGHQQRGSRLVVAGQVIAAVTGIVWFLLLIHGGWGLVFGPMAWIAVIGARRLPLVSVILLIVPTAVLAWSWTPAFINGAELLVLPIVLLLIVPPLIAAGLILVGRRGSV